MIDKYADVATAFGVRDPTLTALENAHRAIDAIGQLSIQIATAKSIEMKWFCARTAVLMPVLNGSESVAPLRCGLSLHASSMRDWCLDEL